MVENFPSKPRLLNLRAPIGKTYLLAFIPIFWFWIFLNLVILRPKVVHACDLDTVLPCYIYKVLFRRKLVFDVCDRFAMAYISPKFKMLYSAINSLEELFARSSDALITVAERLLNTFRAKPEHTAVIMNCAEEDIASHKILHYEPLERAKMREEAENKEKSRHVFTMVYTGNIVRSRGLEKITAAIKDLNDVKLLIAGKPVDKNLLHTLMQLSNVQYKGLLQSAEALALCLQSDAMIFLYDLQIPNNNFSMSNKLFEAMMCGLPVITNVSREIVEDEVGCGIMVEYNDVKQIKAAVTSLKDHTLLCQKLGNNGRKAYQQKYNWGLMEKKLQEIYKNII